MVLKNFFLNVLIRIILISITCFILIRILEQLDKEYIFSFAGIALLLVVQIILLTRFVNRTNRDLARFLSAVRNEDSAIVFDEFKENVTYRDLYKSLNDLGGVINDARAESTKKNLFLENLVNHVGVGLVIFDAEGNVEMVNRAAKEILGVHSLKNIHHLQKGDKSDLSETIINLRPEKPELIRKARSSDEVYEFGQLQRILLKKDIIKSEGKTISLVSLQNIVTELERNELDSWQKLIRVLTHEIMNSISPVISLTKTISKYFTGRESKNPIPSAEVTDRIIEKTLSGLDTIKDTGEGLMDFVTKYRELSQLPKPEFTRFNIHSLFRNVKQLMGEETAGNNISIGIEIDPPDLGLLADIKLLEQVIINLVKNSVEAIGDAKKGKILLRAFRWEDHTFLQVEDNGPGIPGDIIENIFVPFFTTKDNGSGIGLSLSRQIMLLHEGSIAVNSIPGVKTVFTLKF